MVRTITCNEAIWEAFDEEMSRDPKVVLIGEDVSTGIFDVTAGLIERHPNQVLDTPVAEDAFSNMGVGMAFTGMRPVIDYSYSNFVTLAWNAVCTHASTWRYMTGGQVKVPFAAYCFDGVPSSLAPHHGLTVAPLFATVPGIKVAVPSNPADTKGLMKAAIRDDNPALLFCHHSLMDFKGEVPEGEHLVPFGVAEIKRPGSDITIVAMQAMVEKALNAAENLAKQGIEAEVIDPRTLTPFDYDTVIASVKKTGRLITVEESRMKGGIGSDIAAEMQEKLFKHIKSPVLRVTAPAVPVPAAPALQKFYIPQEEDIIAAVKKSLSY